VTATDDDKEYAMTKQVITRGKLPAFQYSPGIGVDDLVFLAGHLGFDADGKLVSDEVTDQVRQAFRNLADTLAAAGAELTDVVRLSLWITSYDDMKAIDEVYREIFPGDLPARTSLLVAGLPLGARFEVDGIAVRGSGSHEIQRVD
jgi:2-iminobutanoate/2-iminopropanoate deaminase